MFEKIGIVTNIWAKEIENRVHFIDLMVEFGENGFKDMEIREGDYLRNSDFGQLIDRLEDVMSTYTDSEFKTICDILWDCVCTQQDYDSNNTKHPELFNQVVGFARKASEIKLSYAMSHPWLSKPDDFETDTQQIVRAKKLAYMFCPSRARLRLVDLDTEGEIDQNAAIANIRRYVSILPDYPMTFAVENARQSASLTLKLAVAGGAKLTYDETNTYRPDGTTLNTPREFWRSVKMDDLTSIHFKQKTEEGVLSEVGDGYVDFKAIKKHLKSRNYTGDLLLENTATKHSLMDAINSREYLLGC